MRALSNDLAAVLSPHALVHLRDAKVTRRPELSASTGDLMALFALRGMKTAPAWIAFEERFGGAVLPTGSVLGIASFLRTCPEVRAKDLPQLDGRVLVPVFGRPEDLEDWGHPMAGLDETGHLALFAGRHPPTLAWDSPLQMLESLATAPLAPLPTLRIDGFQGAEVAELVGARPHWPATGLRCAAWIAEDVWIRELRFPLEADCWSRQRGTFVTARRLDALVPLIQLLLERGVCLGYDGPTSTSDEPALLSFVDHEPELGYLARMNVTIRGAPGRWTVDEHEVR